MILSAILSHIWIILGVIFIGAIIGLGYFKAPPDVAYIISGLRKNPRIIIGKSGLKVPFLERIDKLSLKAMQIDVKTKTSIPTCDFINIKVDATAIVKIGQTPELIEAAAQNFLNAKHDEIMNKVNDLLEGNLREIVGTLGLVQMINDRNSL